jgi:hypothetical protein
MGQQWQHGEIPEEYLEQQRDVAESLDVDGRNFCDEPVVREPCDSDDETDDGGKNDTQEGDQDGVEQADKESTAEGIGLVIGNQAHEDAETRFVVQKVETRADATLFEVMQRIAEDVGKESEDRCENDNLEDQCTLVRIVPEWRPRWHVVLIIHWHQQDEPGVLWLLK